jgi:protein-disulfide isomerase
MHNIAAAVALTLSVMVAGLAGVGAQSPGELEALRKEIAALKDAQLAMQQQLQELLALVRTLQPQAPKAPAQRPLPSALVVAGAPSKGQATAPVTLVEFSDYQCPFCGRHVAQTWGQIETEYVATGKLQYVFRDFPLEQIHPQAFKAAEAARCAGDQRKYWEMHDRLFANQRALGLADLKTHATALELDPAAFDECLASGRHGANIRKDLTDGQAAGVTGTPAFFLGVTNTDGTVKVVRSISGARPFAAFKTAIDEVLAAAGK